MGSSKAELGMGGEDHRKGNGYCTKASWATGGAAHSGDQRWRHTSEEALN